MSEWKGNPDFVPDNPDGTPGTGAQPGGTYRDFIPDPPKKEEKKEPVLPPAPEPPPENPDVTIVTLDRAEHA